MFLKNRFRWIFCLVFSITLLFSCGEDRIVTERSTDKSFNFIVSESYQFSLSGTFDFPLDSIPAIKWEALDFGIVQIDADTVFTYNAEPVIVDNQIARWDTSSVTITTLGKITAVDGGKTTIVAEIGYNLTQSWLVNVEGSATEKGVTINGITWATRNVNTFGFFAANPMRAGLYYQWNDTTGWSQVSAEKGWFHPQSDNDSVWQKQKDPCPEGWRMPTRSEVECLIEAGSRWETRKDNVEGKTVNVNGRVFIDKKDTLFLPAAGSLSQENGELYDINLGGAYWTNSTRFSMDIDTVYGATKDIIQRIDTIFGRHPYSLSFGSGIPQTRNNFSTVGFSCRCVLDKE